MVDSSSGSAHRFERDLHEIRESRGVSIGQVQQQTRIPADVLERFENGRLTGDPNFNEVYLKALVRAYAEAIGLSPSDVVQAHDEQKAGTYTGGLRKHLGENPEAPVRPDVVRVDEPSDEAETPPPTAPPRSKDAAPPAVAALSRANAPKESAPPPPPRPEAKSRVASRESVTSSTSSIDSSWGLIIGGSLVAVLVIAGVLWLLLRDDSPRPVETPPATTEAVEEEPDVAEAPDEPTAAVGDAPRLQTPIRVTLIAEGGALQGFRVTEAPDVRRPFWLEQGQQQTFESETEVILWGTGANEPFGIPEAASVEFQGYRWSPAPGSVVRIDQQRGQALLDSLHRVQAGNPR